MWGRLDARNRRAVVILAVALVVLVAYLVITTAGGGGGGTPAAGPSAPVTTLAPGIPGGLPATTPTTAAGSTPVTFPVYLAKDPFQAPPGAVTTTTAPGGSTTTGTTGTATGGGSGTASGGSGSVGTTGASAAGGTTGGSTAPSRGNQVELLDVYASNGTDYASIRVNDTVYSVSPGQTFDTNYKVVDLSLGTGCGDFAFQSKGFHLCKGQQVLK